MFQNTFWGGLGVTGGVAGGAILSFMTVFSQFTGKASRAENAFVYPGDDLIDANYRNGRSSTYAIDIDAPAYAVWRTIKQLGCNKAGSYSSEFLERIFARLPFYNQYEIQEEWQQPDSLVAGDIGPFDFHGMSMEWVDVVPGKYLVHWTDAKEPPKAPGSYAFRYPGMDHYAAAWCYYLIPLPGNRCRLLNHWRVAYEPDNLWTWFINWCQIELVGGCMAHLQNIYLKRVCEFRKKQQLTGRFMRGMLGGRFFRSATPAGRHDGTPLFEETYTQWMRFGRQDPACRAIREPHTEDSTWPPTGPESPWDSIMDKEYFVDWEEPAFSWEEQIRQKQEKTYLPDWGKKKAAEQ